MMELPDLLARLTDGQPPVTDINPVKVTVTCAWCPDFKPDPTSKSASHGMCQACADRFTADMAAKNV